MLSPSAPHPNNIMIISMSNTTLPADTMNTNNPPTPTQARPPIGAKEYSRRLLAKMAQGK